MPVDSAILRMNKKVNEMEYVYAAMLLHSAERTSMTRPSAQC